MDMVSSYSVLRSDVFLHRYNRSISYEELNAIAQICFVRVGGSSQHTSSFCDRSAGA